MSRSESHGGADAQLTDDRSAAGEPLVGRPRGEEHRRAAFIERFAGSVSASRRVDRRSSVTPVSRSRWRICWLPPPRALARAVGLLAHRPALDDRRENGHASQVHCEAHLNTEESATGLPSGAGFPYAGRTMPENPNHKRWSRREALGLLSAAGAAYRRPATATLRPVRRRRPRPPLRRRPVGRAP